MKDAAKLFLGRHDFRNFSKIDLTNSIDFEYF
jgi:tRNA U38,U39,U40 pseudouridine synthase TruA